MSDSNVWIAKRDYFMTRAGEVLPQVDPAAIAAAPVHLYAPEASIGAVSAETMRLANDALIAWAGFVATTPVPRHLLAIMEAQASSLIESIATTGVEALGAVTPEGRLVQSLTATVLNAHDAAAGRGWDHRDAVDAGHKICSATTRRASRARPAPSTSVSAGQ